MIKPIKTTIKLRIPAGQATPAPPVGPALGQHGLNIQEFCIKFNEATKDKTGSIIPVKVNVYEDRTYDFTLRTPFTSEFLKKAAGIQKGSGKSLQEKVGKVTRQQIREIAEKKMPDLNTDDIEKAMKIVEGTAKQMGLEII